MRQQPSPPSTGRQGEQQQQQIRELVPPLSALSPKTAAAALGMGAGKGAAEKAAGGEFVSGNANYSSCRPHGPSTFFCACMFSLPDGTILGHPCISHMVTEAVSECSVM